MGKHEWMTRRTSRSRYPDASADHDPAGAVKRTRWRIGRAAVWVAAGLVAGMVAVLWMGGAFADPERSVTKIDTTQDKPPRADAKASTNGVENPPDDSSAGPGQRPGRAPKAEMTPAGIKKPAAAEAARLIVHVAGAVKDPGVVTLQQGSRVHEAISAAGGPQQKAQLDAINLAAALEDGQQLYVPTEGEEPVNGTPGSGAATGGTAAGSASPSGSEAAPLVNINTADAAELSTLPGVGPVLSGRIVDWRTEHGAFGSVAELDAVSGIGEKMLATLGELVTV
jgi:competence protein ComEA